MQILPFIVLLLFAILGKMQVLSTDWCEIQKKYCGDKEHIACEPNQFTVNPLCIDIEVIPLNDSIKSLLLEKHNFYRNKLASGKLDKFPMASQMQELAWDNSLQFLAEKHASKCRRVRDQCRATDTYPLSGQSLYSASEWEKDLDPYVSIKLSTIVWWDEWKTTPPKWVDKLDQTGTITTHFTLMANDRSNQMGCGAIRYKEKGVDGEDYQSMLLTCNYQYDNVLGEYIYKKGKPCSTCPHSSCSRVHTSLCAAESNPSPLFPTRRPNPIVPTRRPNPIVPTRRPNPIVPTRRPNPKFTTPASDHEDITSNPDEEVTVYETTETGSATTGHFNYFVLIHTCFFTPFL